jgi:hypothetical protein
MHYRAHQRQRNHRDTLAHAPNRAVPLDVVPTWRGEGGARQVVLARQDSRAVFGVRWRVCGGARDGPALCG